MKLSLLDNKVGSLRFAFFAGDGSFLTAVIVCENGLVLSVSGQAIYAQKYDNLKSIQVAKEWGDKVEGVDLGIYNPPLGYLVELFSKLADCKLSKIVGDEDSLFQSYGVLKFVNGDASLFAFWPDFEDDFIELRLVSVNEQPTHGYKNPKGQSLIEALGVPEYFLNEIDGAGCLRSKEELIRLSDSADPLFINDLLTAYFPFETVSVVMVDRQTLEKLFKAALLTDSYEVDTLELSGKQEQPDAKEVKTLTLLRECKANLSGQQRQPHRVLQAGEKVTLNAVLRRDSVHSSIVKSCGLTGDSEFVYRVDVAGWMYGAYVEPEWVSETI